MVAEVVVEEEGQGGIEDWYCVVSGVTKEPASDYPITALACF